MATVNILLFEGNSSDNLQIVACLCLLHPRIASAASLMRCGWLLQLRQQPRWPAR